ncbi:MAG: hypothetical protein BWK78_03235 [Thiotrichaceae bacterium IS1]|nr:MAG: hypothetical protein BWK78_03235 [Thiotrichaceae bacterium IS1]
MTTHYSTTAAVKFNGHLGSLLSTLLYSAVSFLVWILLGPLSIDLAKEFSLTTSQVGLLVALPILTGLLLLFPVGLLVDHFGPKRIGLILQMLVSLALLGLIQSSITTVTELYAWGILLGLAGTSLVVAIPLISHWYPSRFQGRTLGVAALGGIGTLLTAFLVPTLVDLYGWQLVCQLAAMTMAFTMLIFQLLAKEVSFSVAAQSSLSRHFQIFRDSHTLWYCFLYAVTFGCSISLSVSIIMYCYEYFQISPSTSSILAALGILGGLLCRPLGGWLADQMGGIATLKMTFSLVSIALLSLVWQPNMVFAILTLLITMFVLGLGNGAIFQLISLRFFRQMGVITGLAGMAGGFSGLLLTTSFGWLREVTGYYQTGFLFYASLTLLALITLPGLMQLRFTRPSQKEWATV